MTWKNPAAETMRKLHDQEEVAYPFAHIILNRFIPGGTILPIVYQRELVTS